METPAQPRSAADRRFIVLLAAQSVTLALVVVLTVFVGKSPAGGDVASLVRETAAKLQAAGLAGEAILQYEEYLRSPGIEPRTRAGIAYSVGQMYESEGRPEKALGWYYRVEGADPGSSQQKEAAKRIVAILDALGRHQAAKAVLSGATALDKDKTRGSGKLVAEVGDRKISLEEINAALDALPPQLKQPFEGRDGKKQFLKKYVADELLYEKARRLQYDADPRWLKQLDDIKRQVLVARVIEEEILSKVSVEEGDLRNYFEANKSRYTRDKKIPPFEKARQEAERDYRMEKSQAKYQELVERLVAADNIRLFPENVE